MLKSKVMKSNPNLTLTFSNYFQQQDVKVDPETKEMLDEVGFTFYLILARVYDLDPKLVKTEGQLPSYFEFLLYVSFFMFWSKVNITSQQMEAFNHYRKNTMSIEILKEDHLQKINFRVKNKVRINVDAMP